MKKAFPNPSKYFYKNILFIKSLFKQNKHKISPCVSLPQGRAAQTALVRGPRSAVDEDARFSAFHPIKLSIKLQVRKIQSNMVENIRCYTLKSFLNVKICIS